MPRLDDPLGEVSVRRARPSDRGAAELVYRAAPSELAALAGSPDRARAALTCAWPLGGHSASYEFAWVAEVGGRLAAVAIAFPARRRHSLHAALVRRVLRDLPPARRLRLPFALAWLAASSPRPPRDAFYLGTLAVAARFARRGVASAFRDPIVAHARALGCSRLACHTGVRHVPARRALERNGMRVRRERPRGYALYVMELAGDDGAEV